MSTFRWSAFTVLRARLSRHAGSLLHPTRPVNPPRGNVTNQPAYGFLLKKRGFPESTQSPLPQSLIQLKAQDIIVLTAKMGRF
jgi:hypothetical protein